MRLGGAWVAQSLRFAFTGALPQSVIDSGTHTAIVFALDLSLLVPGMAIGAVLPWRRCPWGLPLGAILMVKGTACTLALLALSAFSAQAHIKGAWDLAPVWALFFLTSLAASGALLGTMRPGQADEAMPPSRPASGHLAKGHVPLS